MKLYICYGTFRSPRPGGHPCRNAYEALKQAVAWAKAHPAGGAVGGGGASA